MINKKLFTNADLNGSYQLVYTHNLNNQDVMPSLFDNDSLQVITADNFSLGDETGNNKDNIVTLNLNNPITGTWKLLLNYQGALETTSGRRAFEFGTGTPADDSRLIFGKAATPSLNITFTSLYTLLLTKLGFLKTAENLNDLIDKAQARTNLGVYSTTAVDNALAQKATLYQAGSGAVLGIATTSEAYTPTARGNPATKGYVDDFGGGLLCKGSKTIGDLGEGANEYTIELPVTLSNTNYFIACMCLDTLGNVIYGWPKSRNTNNFHMYISESNPTGGQNATVYFRIYSL